MGRKSTNPNKTVYHEIRENLGLTREQASEMMECISPQQIERIEMGKVTAHPEDIMIMTKCYHEPGLCNYYCSHECAIGKVHTVEVKSQGLSQIAVETLSALNKLNLEKERILEIAEDGVVTEDEYADFARIKKTLDKIAVTIDELQLWLDKAIANGEIAEDAIK